MSDTAAPAGGTKTKTKPRPGFAYATLHKLVQLLGIVLGIAVVNFF
ncbi:hypothetical protein GUG55_13890, partial [Xanthomonas citri pv. citri]|nr:hypothetical protein [Xanthomonas citri pv. citri]